MTVFFLVIGIIVAVFSFVCALKIKLIIEAREKAAVYLNILFVKIRLYPKKEKKLRISDYSQKKLRKKADRARKKSRAKQSKKAGTDGTNSAKKEKTSFQDVLGTVELVFGLCRTFLSKFSRHLRLELSKVHVNVASEDAAKTAVYYGAANSLVGALIGYLDSIITLNDIDKRDIVINADFLSDKPSIDIRLCASLRVWQAADILFSLALRLVKEKFVNK